MTKNYTLLLVLLCTLFLGHAQAQHSFTETNLAPYSQDFNKLANTAKATDGGTAGNSLDDMKEVYAEAEFGPAATTYRQADIYANDGTYPIASYYHFGSSVDRAFGGIGGFAFGSTSGIGYAGIRLKNGMTTAVIKKPGN